MGSGEHPILQTAALHPCNYCKLVRRMHATPRPKARTPFEKEPPSIFATAHLDVQGRRPIDGRNPQPASPIRCAEGKSAECYLQPEVHADMPWIGSSRCADRFAGCPRYMPWIGQARGREPSWRLSWPS
eukprot:4510692-Pyramimonas_sp.AAC.1